MNPEPPHCPTDCPNRVQKQLGKGYSYLFAIALTTFLGSQAITLEAGSKDWKIRLSPIPMQLYIPGIALIASVLGLDTDKAAQIIGAFLSKGGR